MRVNPSSSFPIHRWLCSLAAGQPIRTGRQGGRSNLCAAKKLDRLLATFLRAGVSGVGGVFWRGQVHAVDLDQVDRRP